MKGGLSGYNTILPVLIQVGILYDYVYVCMYMYVDVYVYVLYTCVYIYIIYIPRVADEGEGIRVQKVSAGANAD